MKNLIERLSETVAEGIVYDVVCHILAGLVAWHVVTGRTAQTVAAFASHFDTVAPVVETATVTPPASIFHAHHRKEGN